MVVGIVGLGLIGGSFAKAYKQSCNTVYAYDMDSSVMDYAIVSETIDAALTRENIRECDIVIIALYPEAAIKYLEDNAKNFSDGQIVMDTCGTKAEVCRAGFELAKKNGFIFVGGHPMAGTQYSGLKYAKPNMFVNAPMVIVPPNFDDIVLLSRVKQLLKPAGISLSLIHI